MASEDDGVMAEVQRLVETLNVTGSSGASVDQIDQLAGTIHARLGLNDTVSVDSLRHFATQLVLDNRHHQPAAPSSTAAAAASRPSSFMNANNFNNNYNNNTITTTNNNTSVRSPKHQQQLQQQQSPASYGLPRNGGGSSAFSSTTREPQQPGMFHTNTNNHQYHSATMPHNNNNNIPFSSSSAQAALPPQQQPRGFGGGLFSQPQQQHQPGTKHSPDRSSLLSQRRGRSPARDATIDNNIINCTNSNDTTNHSSFFPTGGATTTTTARSGFRGKSPNNHSHRTGSPIRNLWGGGNSNKIPPTATATSKSQQQQQPTESRAAARGTSPSPLHFLKRMGARAGASSSPSTTNATAAAAAVDEKRQEEKKDGGHDASFRPGMRDLSPGASPTRSVLGMKRAPSPLQQQGNFFQHPPKQSFLPTTSPVRQPPQQQNATPSTTNTSATTSSTTSRPSTPVNGPSSRCSSPFTARPGLQEGEDGDSLSISGRSPLRSFSSSIPTIPQQPSNVISSGMSSTVQQQQPYRNSHQRPGMPLGGAGYLLHRRTHSGGIDLDGDSIKPIPHRAHSRSPLRRPPTDDDGDRQPIPPRAFSVSPRGRAAVFLQPKEQLLRPKGGIVGDGNHDDDGIQIPDLDGLSMQDFAPFVANEDPFLNTSSSMFTPPPPRSMPSNWAQNEDNDLYTAEPVPTNSYAAAQSDGNSRLPPNGSLGASSVLNPIDVQFRCDLSPTTKARSRLPGRTSSRRTNRVDLPTFASPPLSSGPDEMFSPMDVDEPSPAPLAPDATQASLQRVNNSGGSDHFQMGVSHTGSRTRPAPRVRRDSAGAAKIAADIPLPRSTDNSFSSVVGEHAPTSASLAQEMQSSRYGMDYSGKMGFIAAKREEAKNFYMTSDYRASIASYTAAIKRFGEPPALPSCDILAVLLSNRAAGLLMVGAYEAAVADCQVALCKVSPPRNNEPFSNDSGPLLKIKLFTRLARAQLKLGDHGAASDACSVAIDTAIEASLFSKENHSLEVFERNNATLSQMVTEATLSQGDAKRLRDACEQLNRTRSVKPRNSNDRSKHVESLGHVNLALSIASGSVYLIDIKALLLVQLKRWREVAGFCERLAAFNVGMDLVFIEDLESKHPFPGVSPAQVLKADFFGGLRDEDVSTRDLKLNSRAAAEAACRLPYSISSIYVRAMRLEERYPAADAALRALEDYVRRDPKTAPMGQHFAWLLDERSKLERTKDGRELGDELFRLQAFEKAASKYAECMCIDSMGVADTTEGLNAGGRLHAVLHCNRAACLMALRQFHGAVDECTNALKIHSRYMKAILRRARCYTRLQRTQEAISEYQRWLDLVEEARKVDYSPQSPCLFDGPQDVKPSEVTLTKKELDDVYKAKRRSEATARDDVRRQQERERQRFMDNFSSSWRSSANNNAQDRRDEWYNEQGGSSRRWDSFTNRGPRSSSNPRPEVGSGGRDNSTRSNSQGRPRQESLVSPRSNTADHYSILNLTPHASIDDIKKSFRKLALKYHPDKNQDEGAVDNFRRVKVAHEILSDPAKRRQYDAELRLGRPY